MKEVKKGYYDSQDRFNSIDGNNFGGCLKQVFDLKNDTVLEWRIRKKDNTMCIIDYFEKGKGYNIYESEKI